MTNWPFSKRSPRSRVVVKENCVSVQCRTERTRSLPIVAKMPARVLEAPGRNLTARAVRALRISAHGPRSAGYDRAGHRSQLLHDDASAGIQVHMVAVAVATGGRVIAVAVALRVDHRVARLSVQDDGRGQVLAEGRLFGRPDSRRRRAERRSANHPDPRRGFHDRLLSYQSLLKLVRWLRMAQMASREEATALASPGSSSCSSVTTLMSSSS